MLIDEAPMFRDDQYKEKKVIIIKNATSFSLFYVFSL